MKTLAYRAHGAFHVVVNGPAAITDREWNEYVADLRRGMTAGVTTRDARTLILSGGAVPNAAQRKLIADLLDGRSAKTAFVAVGLVTRTMATAFTWFNREFRVFEAEHIADALDFLGVPAERCFEVWGDVVDLCAELGVDAVETFGPGPSPDAPARG